MVALSGFVSLIEIVLADDRFRRATIPTALVGWLGLIGLMLSHVLPISGPMLTVVWLLPVAGYGMLAVFGVIGLLAGTYVSNRGTRWFVASLSGSMSLSVLKLGI